MRVFQTSLLLFLLTVASLASAQVRVEATSYTPPVVTISSDTSVIRNCARTNAVVRLSAQTTSQSTSLARYTWTTDAGRIEGNGDSARWILDGAEPGYHHVYLESVLGNASDECRVLASTTVLVECLPAPECPQISIVCPDRVDTGKPILFGSLVNGTLGSSPLAYNWTITPGTILEGQGSDSVRVNTTGLEGQTITATVALAGYDSSSARCSASCSVQIPVAETCKKFEEYPEISRNEEKARLDNFGIAVQNDPFATANVIIHPGTSGRWTDSDKRRREILDYLINSRGMDGKRIRIQIGSPLSTGLIELWLCPRGVTLP